MTESPHREYLQNLIEYQFTDVSKLKRALTAAGAEGDKYGNPEEQCDYDGNRSLSRIGYLALVLAVRRMALLEGMSRGKCNHND
jgi:hypothetical protein